MHWYEAEVQHLEQRQKSNPAPPDCVPFYGSSSIRLWDTLEKDFPNQPVVNRGFGGSTMEACSWFYWRLVRPLQPRALVIYAGDNDLGDGHPPAEVSRQFSFLLDQIDKSFGHIPLAVLAIKPSPIRWQLRERIRATNKALETKLNQRPQSIFIDTFGTMLENNAPRTELFADDGLHLSRLGYELWTELLWQHREPIFGVS